MTHKLETALLKLYNDRSDMFYAHLFLHVERKRTKECPTMGVTVKNGKLQMVYNEDFVEKLSISQVKEVIKHEALHLINDHLNRSEAFKNKDSSMMQVENIAMDCAINQYLNERIIEEIGGVTFNSFVDLLKQTKPSDVQRKETKDYYFSLLKDEMNERKQNGEGEKFEKMLEDLSMDDHSGSQRELDPLDQAMLKDAILKAAEQTKQSNAGRLSGDLEEILKVLKKPRIPWQRELKRFFGSRLKANKKSSRSKRNRRYGITYAGKKKDHVAKILVALDTSGSMSGDRTEKVLSEIYGIYKNNKSIAIDICECDSEIREVFSYDGKDSFKISGRGGTDMVPALEYAKVNKYDGVIMLSDGEYWNEDFGTYSGLNSLWVISDNDGYKSPIGRTINI